MSLKEYFLREVHAGDRIEVVYAALAKPVLGDVIHITSDLLQLQCSERVLWIAVESILSFALVDNRSGKLKDASKETSGDTAPHRADKLYEQLPPEIEVSRPIPAYTNQEGDVMVHLLILNGNERNRGTERQRADNIRLAIDSVDGVTPKGEFPVLLDTLYGGRSSEKILTFRLSEQVMRLGSFPLTVHYTYFYDISASDTRKGEGTFRDMIIISRDKKPKIVNRFRDYVGNPIWDSSMFYGRDKIIQDLLSMIRTEGGRLNYGHGALLYGQTRAGKSSIAYHFAKRLREQESSNIVLVDMGNIEAFLTSGSELNESFFYSDFLLKMDDEIQNHHPKLKEYLTSRNIVSPTEKVVTESRQAQFLFTGYLRRICNIIQDPDISGEPEKMIVIIADEFSAIHSAMENNSLPASFMRTWKAMLQNYGLFAVCFGQDDTPQFVREHENAFMSMELRKVSYLEEYPAKELIWQPIAIQDDSAGEEDALTEDSGEEFENDKRWKSRFDKEALNTLYHLTHGSAFLTMKMCSYLVDYLNEMGVNELGEGAVTSALIQSFLEKKVLIPGGCFEERDFEPQINDRGNPQLREENRALLVAIARNSRETGTAAIDALKCPGLTEERKMELLRRLEERDVIEVERNRVCRIQVDLLAKWLFMKYGEGAES